MTRILIKGAGQYQDEELALCASPIACAVTDAWMHHDNPDHVVRGLGPAAKRLSETLDALESATRESPLRKVKS